MHSEDSRESDTNNSAGHASGARNDGTPAFDVSDGDGACAPSAGDDSGDVGDEGRGVVVGLEGLEGLEGEEGDVGTADVASGASTIKLLAVGATSSLAEDRRTSR